MYLSHYNLESKPFQMSTDPDFLWLGEKHKEALATLKYAVAENKGILALTGDVGTGKTTLINALIQSLGDDTLAATIYDPSLGVLEFFNIISLAFNMGRTFDGKGEFLIYFKRFLKEVRAQNKKVLLIIDEAQRISNELLEEIRLLSNLEDEYVRLLNIFFVGQNEFIDILKEYKNRALRQRITLRYHIEPLTPIETEAYTRHRLKIAGAKAHIFSSGAIQEIFSFSSGYPRLINIICDHALLSGYVRELLIITEDIIKECKEELQISNLNMGQDTYNLYNEGKSKPELPVIQREESPRHKKNRTRSVATGIGLLVVIGLLAGYVFYSPVKTSSTPSSSQALLKGKTTVFGQPEEKNDLRTTVPPAPEKKANKVPDTVEIGKGEGSRYYIVKGPEPKLIKETDTKKGASSSSIPSEPVAGPADIAATSGGNKAPEAPVAASKIESEKPKITPPKTKSPETKSVLVEKKTLDKDRAKLDVLGKKDLSPQKDRAIVPKVNKIAPAPSEKQTPPVMAKSFNTVQKPAASVFVSEKDKPPVKTPAISESPTAGVAAVAKAPEEKKIVSYTEQKAVAEYRKSIESKASTGSNFAVEDLQSRLNIFLSKYCRTYEKEQLGQFAAFFTPDAMEKGKSFTSRLDQYRRTFERVDSMNYRIELKRYAIQEGTGAIKLEGVFYARARLVENRKWLENTGPIAMELVAHGDSFQVRRLEY
jgi:type II secretory pathway predicted ATPase ExeA